MVGEYKYQNIEKLMSDLLAIIDGDIYPANNGISRVKEFTIRMNLLEIGEFLRDIKDLNSIEAIANGDRTPKTFIMNSDIKVNIAIV